MWACELCVQIQTNKWTYTHYICIRDTTEKLQKYVIKFYFSYTSYGFVCASTNNTVAFRLILQIHCFLIVSFVLLCSRPFYSILSPVLGFDYICLWELASYRFFFFFFSSELLCLSLLSFFFALALARVFAFFLFLFLSTASRTKVV